MESIWKTWAQVKQHCKGKKIILFGRSEDWVFKTLPRLSHTPDYIVDSNPAYTNQKFHDLLVQSPEKLNSENTDDIYIIITAGPYESVASQLEESGYIPGKNFCCTPEMNDLRALQDIRECEQTLIVSSPDYTDKYHRRYSRLGGGIYTYDIGGRELKQIVPGHFRQMTRGNDVIYTCEYVEKYMYVLSCSLEVLDKFPLVYTNACGVAYHPESNLIFVANTGADTISAYDASTYKSVEEVSISEKYRISGVAQHHINDLCIVDNSLYVGYFSKSGNWKRGMLDGGIDEYNINNLHQAPLNVVSDLWMPHSIEFLDGDLCYLDTMRGLFHTSDKKIAGYFPGFLRGLTYDNRFYYIGQSENYYMSRLKGVSNNIMLNTGIYLFDVEAKVSRFYPFFDLSGIHDLLVLEGGVLK